MINEEKISLIARNTDEVMTDDDLKMMIESGQQINHYIGFEISGMVHLGTGLVCMQKVKDIMDAGVNCHIFLADWHSWINDKLGGDREKINKFTHEYFAHTLKLCFEVLGGDSSKLNFVMGSDLYKEDNNFWETVVEISKNTTLSRMKRSITILGRSEGGAIDFAKLMYPAMQVADIFTMQTHIAHAGIDQRKAQVIARDVAMKLKISPLKIGEETVKPVGVHHKLLLGLQKPTVWPIPEEMNKQDLWSSMKMSKSMPNSAVFVHDSEEEIRKKISKAFCPEGEVEFNPVIDWVENLIFTQQDILTIERKEEHGGDIEFNNIEEVRESFKKNDLHPMDLKKAVTNFLVDKLKPIRDEFEKQEKKELLEELKSLVSR